MDLWEAKKMARELMREHGIGHWKLSWMDMRHTAGMCKTTHWHTKPSKSYGEIQLSKVFFVYFDVMEARDCILHEIAHALTHPGMPDHGNVWRNRARSIGGSGNQYVDRREHAQPQFDYIGTCPQGHTLRMRSVANVSCKKCNDHLGGDHPFTFTEAPKPKGWVTLLQDIFLGV